MRFEVLGPLRLAGTTAEPAGELQRVLLGLLLSRANSPVSADLLIDAMWGSVPDPKALQRLQFHVHKLRRVLDEPDRLSFEPAGYRLLVRDGESDAGVFTALVDEAMAGTDPARRAACLREALDLWRGTPYEGIENPALDEEVRRLAERRLMALESWYEAEISLGNHARIIADLTGTVRAHPLRERLHALLMSALHRAGRRVDALAVYRAARRTLVEELGIEPGAELRAAEARILAGDPPAAAEPEPVESPAQLPHTVRGFVGRDTELSTLDEWLAEETLIVLSGTGGVGKTALAVRWAHRVRDEFPDGQLYVDLGGYGPREPSPPEEVLAGFLLALGVDREALPHGVQERSARFRSMIAGRRLLLVLDNASTVDQVRPLLPGTPSVSVLVTSRDQLGGLVVREGARRLDLDRLPAERARELLAALLGDRITDAEADAMVDRCARLPLALRVAAELIRSRPERSAAELIAELADEQGQLDALDVVGDPHASVRAVLSWSYGHLPAEAARLFRLSALHPGSVFCVFTLAALTGAGVRTTRRLVDLLTAANLLDRTPDGQYHPHDLLRAYADELVHEIDSAADRRAARTRLFDYYQCAVSAAMDVGDPTPTFPRPPAPAATHAVPPFPDRAAARYWLDFERANLVTVACHAADHGWSAVAMHLSGALAGQLAGYPDEGTAVHDAARRAARASGDRVVEANATRLIGNLRLHVGDSAGAIDHYRQALDLFLAADDRFSAGVVLSHLGWAHSSRGEYVESLDSFERARQATESLDETDRTADQTVRCVALTGLGWVHLELGHVDDAQARLTEALDLALRAGFRRREGRIRIMLSTAYARLGQYEPAREHGERAELIATETGDLTGRTQLFELGRIYWHLGRPYDAYAVLDRTLTTARERGMKAHEAWTLLVLGDVHRLDGRPDDAVRDFRTALDLSEQSGARRDQARALDGLGDATAALGEHQLAGTYWARALAIFRELDVPEVAEVAAKLEAGADVSHPASGRPRRAPA